LRFAAEHLADEEREGAAMREHGLVHDFDWQAVAKQTARNQAVTVMAGTVAPLQECLVLGWRRVMTPNVAVVDTSTISGSGGGRLTRPCS